MFSLYTYPQALLQLLLFIDNSKKKIEYDRQHDPSTIKRLFARGMVRTDPIAFPKKHLTS